MAVVFNHSFALQTQTVEHQYVICRIYTKHSSHKDLAEDYARLLTTILHKYFEIKQTKSNEYSSIVAVSSAHSRARVQGCVSDSNRENSTDEKSYKFPYST